MNPLPPHHATPFHNPTATSVHRTLGPEGHRERGDRAPVRAGDKEEKGSADGEGHVEEGVDKGIDDAHVGVVLDLQVARQGVHRAPEHGALLLHALEPLVAVPLRSLPVDLAQALTTRARPGEVLGLLGDTLGRQRVAADALLAVQRRGALGPGHVGACEGVLGACRGWGGGSHSLVHGVAHAQPQARRPGGKHPGRKGR
mmetsp:Transcript_29414/g.74616  ORF Transcript_29414/g.74616 Transcript_29414/m.74616 type:complete len:200 (-) Transcript_29414:87-686(-)